MKLENIVNNLNYVSLQLASDRTIALNLEGRLISDNPYDVLYNEREIRRNMNLTSSTNPNIGLTFYYDEEVKEPLFQDTSLVRKFEPENFPVFKRYGNDRTSYSDENMYQSAVWTPEPIQLSARR